MKTDSEFEGFVIAGAGVAGLATALALHRVGIKSVVFERADNLRTTGAALGVWTNAWKALEELGVADYLRQHYQPLEGAELASLASGITRYFPLQTNINARPHELRCVTRAVLLETLADSLPAGTIKFNCKIIGVRQSHSRKLSAEAELEDGTIIRAKGVIACDGVNSLIAQSFLGLPAASSSGRYGIRGMATFQEGHSLPPKLHFQFLQNVLFGRVPLNEKDLFWFIASTSTPPTPDYSQIANDPVLILKWSEFLLRDFPEQSLQVMKKTACHNQSPSMATLRFRWPWNVLRESSVCKGCVTAAGDALHPTTPDLGQGGCSALEDAIVIARCLAEAETHEEKSHPDEKGRQIVEEAFKMYHKQRKWRWVWLMSQAYVTGLLQQGSSVFMRFMRDWIILKVRTPKDVFIHADYDCGSLPFRTM